MVFHGLAEYVRLYYKILKSLLLSVIQISTTIFWLDPELVILLFMFYSLSSEKKIVHRSNHIYFCTYVELNADTYIQVVPRLQSKKK